jgi:hypothetical protein
MPMFRYFFDYGWDYICYGEADWPSYSQWMVPGTELED